MTISNMTFHEYYGNLPAKTLRLIKKFNVSPADYDLMLDLLGNVAWDSEKSVTRWHVIDAHIVSNSETGMYIPRYF